MAGFFRGFPIRYTYLAVKYGRRDGSLRKEEAVSGKPGCRFFLRQERGPSVSNPASWMGAGF